MKIIVRFGQLTLLLCAALAPSRLGGPAGRAVPSTAGLTEPAIVDPVFALAHTPQLPILHSLPADRPLDGSGSAWLSRPTGDLILSLLPRDGSAWPLSAAGPAPMAGLEAAMAVPHEGDDTIEMFDLSLANEPISRRSLVPDALPDGSAVLPPGCDADFGGPSAQTCDDVQLPPAGRAMRLPAVPLRPLPHVKNVDLQLIGLIDAPPLKPVHAESGTLSIYAIAGLVLGLAWALRGEGAAAPESEVNVAARLARSDPWGPPSRARRLRRPASADRPPIQAAKRPHPRPTDRPEIQLIGAD